MRPTGSYRPLLENVDMNSDFWATAHILDALSESERIKAIKAGFSVDVAVATKQNFRLETRAMAELLSLSVATYERRRRDSKPLTATASERLDRIAAVAVLAEDVFGDRRAASRWMSLPNAALGGGIPVMYCETAIGAQQVRRILRALEWGGSA